MKIDRRTFLGRDSARAWPALVLPARGLAQAPGAAS